MVVANGAVIAAGSCMCAWKAGLMDQKVVYVMLQGLPSRSLLDEMAAAKDVETALIAALKVFPLCSLLLTPSHATLPLAHLGLSYAPLVPECLY